MSRIFRLRLALGFMLVLSGAGLASACDPDLIDSALEQAEAHLAYALSSDDVEAARVNLRRAAHGLREAEAQLISCNCQNAPIEAANAASEALRASNAQALSDMSIAVDAAIAGFELTVLAMQEELCR